MTPQYFLDSSFVLALIDANDVLHQRALVALDKVTAGDHEIYLSDILLNEVLTVLAKRSESRKAMAEFPLLLQSFKKFVEGRPVLCLYELFNKNFGHALSMMEAEKGALSFHDCLFVLFLQEVPKVTLITFDQDFTRMTGISVLTC